MTRFASFRLLSTTILVAGSVATTACQQDVTSPMGADPALAQSMPQTTVLSSEGAVQPEVRTPVAAGSADLGSARAKQDAARQGRPANARRPIPGQFIVVFKDDVRDAPGLVKRLTAEHGAKLRFEYSGVLKGFSFELPEAAAERVAAALARNPQVAYIEANQAANGDGTQYMTSADGSSGAWGLDRLDQRYLPLSGSNYYAATGYGVNAYIIDSGILPGHAEFGGRARIAMNFVNDGRNGADCHGHGTHVAGITGGKTFGVAKQVTLYGVKVLDCYNNGTSDLVIAGVNWVYLNRRNPAVANISIGSGFSQAMNDAVTRLAASGVFVAVAAGNAASNACYSSPASAAGAFTTGSSTRSDGRASTSNWGACVDAYAPGDQIHSAGITSYSTTMSGTSMASPHVAGVAAMFKQTYGNYASADIVNSLISWSTTNIVVGGSYGSTPNRLLYKGGL